MPHLSAATLLFAIVVGAFPAAGFALDEIADTKPQSNQADEWLAVNGVVEEVEVDRFTVDFGSEPITVDMDRYAGYDTDFVEPGQWITVSAPITAPLLSQRIMDARSVYLRPANALYLAMPLGHGDGPHAANFVSAGLAGHVLDERWMAVTGFVRRMDAQQLFLDTGAVTLAVGTTRLRVEEGYAVEDHVRVGDRISVSAKPGSSSLFEDRRIVANSLVVVEPMRSPIPSASTDGARSVVAHP